MVTLSAGMGVCPSGLIERLSRTKAWPACLPVISTQREAGRRASRVQFAGGSSIHVSFGSCSIISAAEFVGQTRRDCHNREASEVSAPTRQEARPGADLVGPSR